MEYLPFQFFNFIKNRISQRNLKLLLSLVVNLVVLILFNSMLFMILMSLEGQDHNFFDALYWTLTIFTTLGLGDIVFSTTGGHVFTVWVLLSGIAAFFILTPYVLYQFFQSESRAPRSLSKKISGHVLIIGYNPITKTLIDYLTRFKQTYTLITSDLEEGLHLHDNGLNVVVGDVFDPNTYEKVRINNAAMIVTAESAKLNANIALTVREINEKIPVTATASAGKEGILKAAGCTHVLNPDLMVGKSLARRILAGDAVAHLIGVFEQFVIAESSVTNTPMVDKTIRECRIREISGVNVIGIWERGMYEPAGPDTKIGKNSILVLAGTKKQIDNYNALFCIYNVSEPQVIMIGSGHVGIAVARELNARRIKYKILDLNKSYPLVEAGGDDNALYDESIIDAREIKEASAVIITTEDDNLNIFITLSLRRMNPEIQIISRSISEKNVSTLYHAGADFVISYAGMGASAISNILHGGDFLIITEGLNILRLDVPKKISGKKISETGIRKNTGCSIIAIQNEREFVVNPEPDEPLPDKGKIYIIGNPEAEKIFYKIYT